MGMTNHQEAVLIAAMEHDMMVQAEDDALLFLTDY